MYCGGADGSITTVNTDAAPIAGTCTLGRVGSNFGFYFQNGTLTTTTLAAFRVAQKVTKIAGTAGVTGAATTFGTVIESLTSTATAVTDWKATANLFATAIITWGATGLTCDILKWDSATGCHGVDMPWGNGVF